MMGGMGGFGGAEGAFGRGMLDEHLVENSDTFLRAFLTGHTNASSKDSNNNNDNNYRDSNIDIEDDRYLINFIKGVMAQENAVKSDMIDVLKDQISILRQELNNKQSVIDSLLRHYEKPCPHNNNNNKINGNNPFTSLNFDGEPSEKPVITLYSTSSPIPPPMVTNSNDSQRNGSHGNLLLSSSIASCLSDESLNSLVSKVTLRATKTTKDGVEKNYNGEYGGDNDYYCFNGTGLAGRGDHPDGNEYDDCGQKRTARGRECVDEYVNECPNEYPDECVNEYTNELSNDFTNEAYGMSNGFSSDSNEIPGDLSNEVIDPSNAKQKNNREQLKTPQRAPIHACIDPCKPLSETLLSLRNSIKSNASSSSNGSSVTERSSNGGYADEKRVSSNKTIRVSFNKKGNRVATKKND